MLKGTSSTLNIFTITAAQFGDTNRPLDIQAPAGSTIIINVTGSHPTLGTGIYYNESQNSGDNSLNDNILFNFADAQTVTINGQFNASLLAPFAVPTGNTQMGGNFIAAAIGQTAKCITTSSPELLIHHQRLCSRARQLRGHGLRTRRIRWGDASPLQTLSIVCFCLGPGASSQGRTILTHVQRPATR